MLVSLSVNNIKSIGKEARFTLLPGRTKSLPEHIVEGNILKTCVVFGQNGSGKSTIIYALKYLQDIVAGKPTLDGKCLLESNHDNDIITIEITISCRPHKVNQCIQETSDFRNKSPKMGANSDSNYTYHIEINPNLPLVVSEQVLYEGSKSICVFNSQRKDQIETDEYKQLTLMAEIDREISCKYDKISKLAKIIEELESLPYYETGEFCLEDDVFNDNINNNKKAITSKIRDYREEQIKLRMAVDHLKEKQKKIAKEHLRQPHTSQKCLLIPLYNFDGSSLEDYSLENGELDARYAIRTWLLNTLTIIGTDDYFINSLDSCELEKISKIVSQFDLGINGILWEQISDIERIKSIICDTSPNDKTEIHRISQNIFDIDTSYSFSTARGIYKIERHRGDLSLYQIVTVHNDGKRYPINTESDGTRRVIELASILLPSDEDRVFVIDELDYRLHPTLVKKFLELFYRHESKGRKQLIFTTHETNLMSRDLFRLDEMWVAEQDDEGSSVYYSIADMGKKITKRLDDLYLNEQVLGGIPHIKKS